MYSFSDAHPCNYATICGTKVYINAPSLLLGENINTINMDGVRKVHQVAEENLSSNGHVGCV